MTTKQFSELKAGDRFTMLSGSIPRMWTVIQREGKGLVARMEPAPGNPSRECRYSAFEACIRLAIVERKAKQA